MVFRYTILIDDEYIHSIMIEESKMQSHLLDDDAAWWRQRSTPYYLTKRSATQAGIFPEISDGEKYIIINNYLLLLLLLLLLWK